ncbi:MAG TPA: hypothetical protein ENK18_25370 [Deltaproteobacteria bacterium]|nr:hypothetical protein [Deltaproteobacteria bacterium]
MIGVFFLLTAAAQGPEPTPTFSFDRMLLTTFQAVDPELQGEADRLHALLFERFTETNDTIPMSEVPGFAVHDYGPELYMQGCPPGRYPGCALVLGQRALADWVVGATLHIEADEFAPETSHLVLDVHLVDVADAREVASFSIPLMGDEETALNGIVGVYSDMLEGAYQLRDLRDDDGTAEAEIEAARKALVAASLTELEEQLGFLVPKGRVGALEGPKLTRRDLEKYATDDDIPPWERVGMGQQQYLRFSNSGKDLQTWRGEHRGLFGDVVVRASGGFGGGPWHQSYVAQLLRSDQTLQPIHTVQFLEVVNGSTAAAELEVGLGVLSFLEVSGVGGLHTGQTTLLKDEDVQNQVPVPSSPQQVPMTTYHLGGRVTLVPLPHHTARPLLAAGLVSWRGSGVPAADNYARLDAPRLVLLQILAGAEVEASPNASLFARLGPEVPLGGVPEQLYDEGAGLEQIPRPTGERGAGLIVQVGIQLHVGPLVPRRSPSGW